MRYMARRIGGDWITRDLTLTDVEFTLNLSGPTTINANLAPETNAFLWEDRLRVGEDWATMIYAIDEYSGDPLGHGIVLPPTQYDDLARLTCAGVSTYPHGYIYTGSRLWGPQAATKAVKDKHGNVKTPAKPEIPRPDPIKIVRDHWEWIQDQHASELGVSITGDLDTGQRANGDPVVAIGNYAEPYRLRKWDAPDLGNEIDTLAQVTPFDYVEKVAWANAAKTEVEHTIKIGYPRLGRKRDDLRFALGENIAAVPAVATVEAGANMLIGLGKGEAGPSMVYEEMPWDDGRLRRHRVLTDKTASKEVLKRRMAIYREALNQRYDVTSLAVVDHPNARLSSIQLGDDIRVQAEHPEYGPLDLYVRVLSITRGESDEAAVLTTSASVFFIYKPTEELS